MTSLLVEKFSYSAYNKLTPHVFTISRLNRMASCYYVHDGFILPV